MPLDGNSEGWDLAGKSPEATVPHMEKTGLCYTCNKGEVWSRTGREKPPPRFHQTIFWGSISNSLQKCNVTTPALFPTGVSFSIIGMQQQQQQQCLRLASSTCRIAAAAQSPAPTAHQEGALPSHYPPPTHTHTNPAHSHGWGARRLRVIRRVNLWGRRVGIAWRLWVGRSPIALRRRRGLVIEAIVKLFLRSA